jgi:hypothetical protein
MVERSERLARASAARARRDHGLGTMLIWLGAAIVVVPSIAWIVLEYATDVRWDGDGAAAAFAVAAALVVITRGRRMRAAAGDQLLAEDARAPIVYLRPFDADGAQIAKTWGSRLRLSVWDQYGMTYEERLARTLRKVGPFVAIGDPTETLPGLGAGRLYAADETWQVTVDELTARAGAVLLQAGESEGVAWEVHHVVALGAPERVILSLPLAKKRRESSRRKRYDAFRRRFGDVFPRPLPEAIGHCQFAYFDADWTPRLLGGRGASLPVGDDTRTLALGRLAREFKITWGPRWVRMSTYTVGGLAILYGITSLLP